jgi:hypothetical protein
MRRLGAVVERLALEQRESLKAESAAADVFSSVSNRVAVVEKAFGDLADAVSEELRVSRAEREKWSAHLEAARVVVDACDARTSACVERCDALANTFDDHETARLEARAAAAAVVEARAVLAEAERRAEDTAGRLQSLQDVARGADAALQAQVDEIRDAVVSLDARVGVGVGVSGAGVSGSGATQGDHKVADASHITTRDILLAGAASEADVVALRDWTRRTAGAHAERLARVEAAVEAETKKTKKKSGKNANAKRSSSRDGDASETRGVPTPTSRRRSSEDRSSEGSA